MEEQESNKNLELHHLNPKLTKAQASSLNLPKLLSQFHKEFIQRNDFRESSLFLSELATVYLKQFKYLRVDIENLKNSLFQKKIEIVEKIKKNNKTKETKRQKANNESEFNIEQNTFTFKDQPRNLVSADKIQLQNQQRPSVDVGKMLKRENDEQLDSQYKIELVVKDLSQIQKKSLGEILNKTIQRKRELAIPQANTNFQIENQQLFIKQNFEEEEEQHMIFEDNENLQEQEIKLSAQKIYSEMPFQQQQQEKKKIKPFKQRNKANKVGFIDSRIQEETDCEYKRNIQSFLKISQKVDDLQLKMELLKLEPEFWAQDDALFNLINQISILDPQQNLLQNSFNPQNALTSPIQSKKNGFYNNQLIDQQESNIHEFNYCDEIQPKMSQSQKEMSYYKQLIENVQNKLQNQCLISDEEYFRACINVEQNKAKQFYDLLIMSRIGMVQLQQFKKFDDYSQISFKIK